MMKKKMSFKKFVEAVKAALAEEFNYTFEEVVVKKLQKSYHGLAIKKIGAEVATSPVLNMDTAYEKYNGSEVSFQNTLNAVKDSVSESMKQLESVHITAERVKNYQQIKDRLFLQMVSVEGNEEMLATVPHKTMADLAVVYRIEVAIEEGTSTGSFLITRAYCDMAGISEEQLEADAREICEKNYPMTIKNMATVLFGKTEEELDDTENLWVVDHCKGKYGASVISYPGALENIAEKFGSSFYVIPSSVHEILVTPDSIETNAKSLDALIEEVNATEVAVEDRMSNHCYHYDKEAKIFETGKEYEARKKK